MKSDINDMNQLEIQGDEALDKGEFRKAAEFYGTAVNMFVNYPRLDRLARKQTAAMRQAFKEEDKKKCP